MRRAPHLPLRVPRVLAHLSEPEARICMALTESAYEAQVEGLFRLYGYRYYHTQDSRHSRMPGFPDLIAIRVNYFHQLRLGRPAHPRAPIRIWTIELKRWNGRLEDEQAEWLLDFAAIADVVNRHCAGLVEWRTELWRPQDFWRPQDHERLIELLT